MESSIVKIQLVSVITACFNAEDTICYTIESVLNQSYQNWELIIVDDCSTDNSVSVVNKYAIKDARIKLIELDKPSGSPTLPRNIAIENSSGRYLAFLDSDDLWHPSKLKRQIETSQKHNSPLIFSNYEKIDSKGVQNNRLITSPSSVTLMDLYYGNPIGCLTALVDKTMIPNFKFENMGHEDCIAWIRILQLGYIAYNTNSVEALYRESSESVSSNKFKILHWQWGIYRDILKFNFLKSAYYYMHYAIRGVLKSRI